MKKYFAMYTPIEGKVEVGDNYFFGPAEERLVCQDEAEAERCNQHFLISKNSKRLQLSLCTDEIKIGDKVYHPSYNGGKCILATKENEADVLGGAAIVGKISLDAHWVSEGDEFDDYEVKYEYTDDAWHIQCSRCKSIH